MEPLDPEVCYRALRSRDPRFDGRLFVGITSTGIYCRPICPARPAKFENCRFFPLAAAAQEAGFRPCLRCRPETAPDLGAWRGTSNTVSRGLTLIAEGGLDGDDASVDALAERLGVGGRQLRRLFKQHLGASPLAVAQTRRVLFAKQLIHETRLPMAEIALAAGFGSVRQFNETFLQLFRRPPGDLRRKAIVRQRDSVPRTQRGRLSLRLCRPVSLPEGTVAATGVTVRLRYRPPYDWEAMLSFLRTRAIAGVELVDGESYVRTMLVEGRIGAVEVRHLPAHNSLEATIRFPCVRALPGIVERIRRVFDLGADVTTIGTHLRQDPLLAPLVDERPGLRAPGGWDAFELAVRAVLGQQITVGAARQLAGRLVRICGTAVTAEQHSHTALTHCFPSASQVVATDLTSLGMPKARTLALGALAEATLADPLLFYPLRTVEETVARLRAIRGIGEWTAQYIALRAVREPDAFPASDIGLLRGTTARGGLRPVPAELQRRAEPWRPWRAYAAQHLWAADAASRVAKGAIHG